MAASALCRTSWSVRRGRFLSWTLTRVGATTIEVPAGLALGAEQREGLEKATADPPRGRGLPPRDVVRARPRSPGRPGGGAPAPGPAAGGGPPRPHPPPRPAPPEEGGGPASPPRPPDRSRDRAAPTIARNSP